MLNCISNVVKKDVARLLSYNYESYSEIHQGKIVSWNERSNLATFSTMVYNIQWKSKYNNEVVGFLMDLK